MIYYSHINEDNRVERSLLQQGAFPSVVAICGSGERVLSLMDNKASTKFIVVDCNEEALFLLQLKIAALTHLSVEKYLNFIGQGKITGNDRAALFQSFKHKLPAKTLSFWNHHLSHIEKGILHIGHLEQFLRRVRPLTNFWLGKSFQNVFENKTRKNHFPTIRWNLLKKVFSHKIVYQLAGNKDTAFVGSHARMERIPLALDDTFKNRAASSSFMAHLIFRGHLSGMKEDELPPSLQQKILNVIKQRLLKNEISVEYYVADLLDFIRNYSASEQPVFYSLSDILSFDDFNYLHSVIKEIAATEACITGRSFLRNKLTEEQFVILKNYGQLSLHDKEDSTRMYQVFSLQTATKS